MNNTIKIHLKEKTDYQNKYNEKILSYSLSNYILEETKGINPKEKIRSCQTVKGGSVTLPYRWEDRCDRRGRSPDPPFASR